MFVGPWARLSGVFLPLLQIALGRPVTSSVPFATEVLVRRVKIADIVVCGMFPGERSSWSFEKCYMTAGDSAYQVRRCCMCLN